MTGITRVERAFFGLILLAALFLAALGYLLPAELAARLTWLTLPPLHARFVGAIYFFGVVFMIGCLAARCWSDVRLALPSVIIFTGMLLIISLLNLNSFDFSEIGPWLWMASYAILPIAGLVVWWRRGRVGGGETIPGPALPGWARIFLMAQGGVIGLLALVLFVAPDVMATIWPWQITPLLAQTYAGPLFAYAYASLEYGRQGQWAGIKAITPAMLVFSTGTLVASIIHRDLFSATEIPDALWFISFSLITVMLAVITVRALQTRLE